MTIQEFSWQLGREEHPSQLIQALRTLRAEDLDTLKESHALDVGWGEWPPVGGDTPQSPERLPLVYPAGLIFASTSTLLLAGSASVEARRPCDSRSVPVPSDPEKSLRDHS
jgi:hypothetical protein